jgi:hypothetical protein
MTQRFPFAFITPYRIAAAPFGVRPSRAEVVVDEQRGRLVARYGPWSVDTALANVASVEITGPYGIAKTIGPAHLSFADRGLTFASNPRQGVCISFREPVQGMEPTGRMRHPGLTVTVADCDGLAEVLRRNLAG